MLIYKAFSEKIFALRAFEGHAARDCKPYLLKKTKDSLRETELHSTLAPRDWLHDESLIAILTLNSRWRAREGATWGMAGADFFWKEKILERDFFESQLSRIGFVGDGG